MGPVEWWQPWRQVKNKLLMEELRFEEMLGKAMRKKIILKGQRLKTKTNKNPLIVSR